MPTSRLRDQMERSTPGVRRQLALGYRLSGVQRRPVTAAPSGQREATEDRVAAGGEPMITVHLGSRGPAWATPSGEDWTHNPNRLFKEPGGDRYKRR
jgi:hypothetical protein